MTPDKVITWILFAVAVLVVIGIIMYEVRERQKKETAGRIQGEGVSLSSSFDPVRLHAKLDDIRRSIDTQIQTADLNKHISSLTSALITSHKQLHQKLDTIMNKDKEEKGIVQKPGQENKDPTARAKEDTPNPLVTH